jgi:hypothetical protein
MPILGGGQHSYEMFHEILFMEQLTYNVQVRYVVKETFDLFTCPRLSKLIAFKPILSAINSPGRRAVNQSK